MSTPRVLVVYEPFLYREVFVRLFNDWQVGEVSDRPGDEVDIVVFPTNAAGQPQLESLPAPVPKAKLIAISASGDCAWVCRPGDNRWQRLQPFDLPALRREIMARPTPSQAPET